MEHIKKTETIEDSPRASEKSGRWHVVPVLHGEFPYNPRHVPLVQKKTIPRLETKQVFGMHENANITCAIADTEMSFSIVLSMQPRTGGGGGASREDLIGGIAKDMEDR